MTTIEEVEVPLPKVKLSMNTLLPSVSPSLVLNMKTMRIPISST
jgi:hypothetical protein